MRQFHVADKVMVLLLAICFILGVAGTVRAEDPDLTELLEQVGQGYSEAYISPLVTALGINQNSGLYHTAKIPKTGLSISFGIKVMASKIEDDDRIISTNAEVDASALMPGVIPDGTLPM